MFGRKESEGKCGKVERSGIEEKEREEGSVDVHLKKRERE